MHVQNNTLNTFFHVRFQFHFSAIIIFFYVTTAKIVRQQIIKYLFTGYNI